MKTLSSAALAFTLLAGLGVSTPSVALPMASSNIMVTTQDGMSPELVKMSRKMYRKQMRMNKRTMMRQNRDTIMRDGMSR